MKMEHWPRLSARVLTTAAFAVLLAPSASNAATPSAHQASTYSISESAHLHKTSGHGITINQVLNEEGHTSGTISGRIYIHLRVVAVNRVSAEVNIYPSGGSITGKASASFRSSGAVASFHGALTVVRGSGRYNHAHGSGLAFSGTIQRVNDAVSVHLSGRFST
jgi:hypothetical protein